MACPAYFRDGSGQQRIQAPSASADAVRRSRGRAPTMPTGGQAWVCHLSGPTQTLQIAVSGDATFEKPPGSGQTQPSAGSLRNCIVDVAAFRCLTRMPGVFRPPTLAGSRLAFSPARLGRVLLMFPAGRTVPPVHGVLRFIFPIIANEKTIDGELSP